MFRSKVAFVASVAGALVLCGAADSPTGTTTLQLARLTRTYNETLADARQVYRTAVLRADRKRIEALTKLLDEAMRSLNIKLARALNHKLANAKSALREDRLRLDVKRKWTITTSSVLSNGLVAYYHLTQNTNDMAGLRIPLVDYGAEVWHSEGNTRIRGYLFNGQSSYLQANSDEGLPAGDSARSVNFFFRLDPGGTAVYWGPPQQQGTEPGSDFSIYVSRQFVSSDNYYDNGMIRVPIDAGWHMLTVTYARGAIIESVYLDSRFVGSIGLSRPLNTQPGIVRIGAKPDAYGSIQGPFGGILSSIRIYNRVVTVHQMRLLLREGLLRQVSP